MIELLIVLGICLIGVVWKLKPVQGVKNITTNELQTMLRDDNKLFIDVRPAKEFNKMYVSPFINVPIGDHLAQLPKDKEIVVMCKTGIRSLEVCKQLKKLGFPKVTNVKGGILSYSEKGNLNE